MTIHDWQRLAPGEAARELLHRARTRLSPEQQHAVFAHLPSELDLVEELALADRKAPLGGVPYFAKDLFPVAGEGMLAGSTFLPEVRPPSEHDATIVRRLQAAGAVLAGRTHLHEFAYGITGENPHYGDCEHPRFPGRTTGGSSSGSAAAVAADVVPFAIGTDTGGSVRLPAAFCGLYGMRLTPRNPLIADAFPLAPSFDTAGWFAATAAAMATVTTALIGPGLAAKAPVGTYLELPGLDPEVASACAGAATRIGRPADRSTREELLAVFAQSVDSYNTIVADEAWAVHRPWAARYQDRYDPGVWQRLNRVHTLTAPQRESALHAAAAIRRAWQHYFRTNDFLLLPASPCAALTKTECTLANRTRILALTTPASVGGLPVLTIPVPLPSGLTTGLQVVVPAATSPAITWILEQCRAAES